MLAGAGYCIHLSLQKYAAKYLAVDSFLEWDRLKLIKMLSSGGFGSVYKATYAFEEKVEEMVAVKILLRAKIDVDMLREFVQEIALMQKLQHANIITCYGTVWHSPCVGVVMEIAERGSLLNVLRDSTLPLQISDRVRIAAEVARGMSYLHSFDPPIIHRDIKSDNILITGTYVRQCTKLEILIPEMSPHSLWRSSNMFSLTGFVL